MTDLFKYRKYREFLIKEFPRKGDRRGRRRELAKILRCQTSFISLVLTERAHMNEDMVFATGRFLGFNETEMDYFLQSYHYERASTPALQQHYLKLMEAEVAKRSQVSRRVASETSLSAELSAQYYSDWSYAAVHTAVMNPKLNDRDLIGAKLGLEPSHVEKILSFLVNAGLIQRERDRFVSGATRIHLDQASPFIIQHHRNWQLEASRVVAHAQPTHVHYSGALSMGTKDLETVREILLESLSRIEKQIKPSPDEEVAGILINFFPYAGTKRF